MTQEFLNEDGKFDKQRFSHKFKHAGLRYEIAISVKTGWIVHVNGPFKCGEWSDLKIARTLLHKRLCKGEYYFADNGYRDVCGPAVLKEDLNQDEMGPYMRIRMRHETINKRFKEWGIFRQRYHHSELCHGSVFKALAVLIQLDIEDGCNIWNI